jgi:hypothetical protein
MGGAPTFGTTTPSGFAPDAPVHHAPAQPPAPMQAYAPAPAMSPYGAPPQGMQQLDPAYANPGAPYHGPIGKMRNPVMVVVLTYVTCGFYGIFALLSMLGELKAFRQKNDINPILFLIPVVSLLEILKLPAKVLDAKRMAGVPNAQEPNVILYLFLWFYMLPSDLNEIWQIASAKHGYGALPPTP